MFWDKSEFISSPSSITDSSNKPSFHFTDMEQLCMLYEEKTQEANEKCEAVLKCRQQLHDRFLQLKQRRSDLEAKYSACAELHGNVKVDGND
jgi:hypothetical protein